MINFVKVIYPKIEKKCGKAESLLALLIDPDDTSAETLPGLVEAANASGVDLIFIGGSMVLSQGFDDLVHAIKSNADMPVVLFPGSILQLSGHADAILFLSLISGRNPELLIGQHVIAATKIRHLGLEAISVGYMLIDGGSHSAVNYMSNTLPIPRRSVDIAVSTSIAGEMLGLKTIYLDAGSGARLKVPDKMIKAVKKNVNIPLIVGGGIRTPADAAASCKAGADIIVVGNAAEDDIAVLADMVVAVKETNYEVDSHFRHRPF